MKLASQTVHGSHGHYVGTATLERKGFGIACRQFRYEHTAESIAEMLVDVYSEFNIMDIVKDCITDNASNFAKAFSICGREAATFETSGEQTDEDRDDDSGVVEPLECNEIFELLNGVNDYPGFTSLHLPRKGVQAIC